MNKRGQLDEINPVAVIGGLIIGAVAFIIERGVNVSFIWKIGAFVIGSILGYFIILKQID